MVEFPLTGWTAEQRDSLAFLLDDAEIAAEWGPNSLTVDDEHADRVRRFVDFLGATSWEGSDRGADAAAWDRAALPPLERDPTFDDVATPGLRFGGWLVDRVVFCITLIPFAILDTGWIVHTALFSAYVVLGVGLAGRTLANVAVRTRVVPMNGDEVPGLQAGVVRWLVPALPGLVALFALQTGASEVSFWLSIVNIFWSVAVYGPILTGPDHRGLHDRAAGVMVVDDRLVTHRVRRHPAHEEPSL